MTSTKRPLKTVTPSMFRKSKSFYRDNSNERGTYDRNHSQSVGSMNAYTRGEKPLSYWNKKLLKKSFINFLNTLDSKGKKEYLNFLKDLSLDTNSFIKELFELELQELQLVFLEWSGVHYTGNFYRYTHFYRFTDSITTIINSLRVKPLFREFRPVQLKLPIKYEYTQLTFYNN